ncbi:MAG: helicase HerA-like domain-containing protein [Candidatus Hodarchaeales archaeon]
MKVLRIGSELPSEETESPQPFLKKFTIPTNILRTHALVLGASGSGKTVMCKAIVEELILQNIPVIAIDPKGDLGGLGIVFQQELEIADIIPWVREEANERGIKAEDMAAEIRNLYAIQLGRYFDDFTEELESYKNKVGPLLITPKNPAGVPLDLTPDLTRPKNFLKLHEESPEVLLNILELKAQILLQRCGFKDLKPADNRVIFMTEIIRHGWDKLGRAGKSLDLGTIVKLVLKPPFNKVGVIEVEQFISAKLREELARRINAVMVRSIGKGLKLDINKLMGLASQDKTKTPFVVFDLREIRDDTEKQAFVAEVVGAVWSYILGRGGTNRLRLALYFDELYGFIPPVRTPISKSSIMLVLKQARAFGLGCILATQNPGDIDYRALGNISTWILGKMTSDRDVDKVANALKAIIEDGDEYNRVISAVRGLRTSQFYFYNPKIGVKKVKTRWLLSYHGGPLSADLIQRVTIRPEISTSDEEIKKKEMTVVEVSDATEFVEKEFGYTLVLNRPSTPNLEDRYLQAKFRFNENRFRKLLSEKLHINERMDNLNFNFNELDFFYIPVLTFSCAVKMERKLPLPKSAKKDLRLYQEFQRNLELAKDLNWEQSSIQGISLQDTKIASKLVLTPEFNKYAYVSKERVEKTDRNITWFLIKTFPEARAEIEDQETKILKQYYEQQVEKIKKQYAIKKERIQKNIIKNRTKSKEKKAQISIMLQELSDLETNKAQREAEGKAVAAIKKSITSKNKKIEKLNFQIAEHMFQEESLDKELEKLNEEEMKAIAEIKDEIDEIRNRHREKEYYRPTESEIEIKDKYICWIPKAAGQAELTNPENPAVSIIINFNFNLFSKIGTFGRCSVCDKEIQSGYLCSNPNCNELLCEDHVHRCDLCTNGTCETHHRVCEHENCSRNLCYYHATVCADESCGRIVCPRHRAQCNGCQSYFCLRSNHLVQCETCGKQYCEDCQEQDKVLLCPICENYECVEHTKECSSCQKKVCTKHLKPCPNCGELVCPDCHMTKRVGLMGTKEGCKKCLR